MYKERKKEKDVREERRKYKLTLEELLYFSFISPLFLLYFSFIHFLFLYTSFIFDRGHVTDLLRYVLLEVKTITKSPGLLSLSNIKKAEFSGFKA